MKLCFKLFLVFCCSVLLVSDYIVYTDSQIPVVEMSDEQKAGDPTSSEYCYRTNMTEILRDLAYGNDGLYYFGFPDCPWCQEVVPLLVEEASRADQRFLYVQTRDLNHNLRYSQDQARNMSLYFPDYFVRNDEGKVVVYVPLIAAVKDGRLVAAHQGTVEGHDAHQRKMTDDERKECQEAIRDVVSAMGDGKV